MRRMSLKEIKYTNTKWEREKLENHLRSKRVAKMSAVRLSGKTTQQKEKRHKNT